MVINIQWSKRRAISINCTFLFENGLQIYRMLVAVSLKRKQICLNCLLYYKCLFYCSLRLKDKNKNSVTRVAFIVE